MIRRFVPRFLRRLRQSYRALSAPDYDLKCWIAAYADLLGASRSYFIKLPERDDGSPLPWMTYPAIEFFEQLDLSDASIFEYGSGNGSLYWAGRANSVISVESDEAWIEKMRPRHRANQRIIFASERQNYVEAIKECRSRPDVVIVDGKYRLSCAQAAVSAVAPSGLIVVDNSDWFPKTCEFLCSRGFVQIDFVGMGPCNRYTWATSLFIKSMDSILRRRVRGAPCVIGGLVQSGDET